MKYKQRLVTAVVMVAVLVCVATLYKVAAQLINRSAKDRDAPFNGVVADLARGRYLGGAFGTCPSEKTTATYMVDDFYDKVRFTKNSRNGLYILNETETAFADPRTKKILNQTEPLTVIVVPHSHNDPGWLWTLQTYYDVRTKHILSNAVKFLQETPDFRMIWSETIFLKMWWQNANPQERSQLKSLLNNGQLEILSGAGCPLDQLIEGHLWIKDTLGVTVNTSWSIDPFGYSLTLPYLWKKAGMSNMAILRIHGAVKAYMGNRQLLTYQWRQPWDVPGVHDITCHVEPYTLYNIEYSCGPNMELCKRKDFAREPDFPPENSPPHANHKLGIVTQDFEQLAKSIVEQYRLKATQYSHNVILMPHGDDFRYVSYYEWQRQYTNMKRLITFVNSKKEWNVKMKFGTVGEYFDILKKEIKKAEENGKPEPVITGDYFTYTDRDHEYWSGYYTTRPFDKRMIRSLLELLKVTEIVTSYTTAHSQQYGHVFVGLPEVLGALQNARRTHGLVQHHDAITGTSAHPTVMDFEKKVFDAISKLQQVLGKSLQQLLLTKSNHGLPIKPLYIQSSPETTLSPKVLHLSESGSSLVFINGYTQRRKEVQSIIVNTPDVEMFDEGGHSIPVQVSPYIGEHTAKYGYTTGKFIILKYYQVYFELSIAPVSCVSYIIQKSKSPSTITPTVSIYNGKLQQSGPSFFDIRELQGNISGVLKIETPHLVTEFSSINGTLQRMCENRDKGVCADLKLDWVSYQTGNSNAYTFGTSVKAIQSLLGVTRPIIVISGKLVSQVRISHAHFQHVVTLYHNEGVQGKAVHIDNVATLNPKMNPDVELMMRFETDIVNEHGRYFTDSNGFQLVSRLYRSELPIGANFYPITSMMVLEDKSRRLTLHAAQPHGVASLGDGHIDVMMERIPMSKGKGLEEAVLDQKPAPSKMLLSLEHASSSRPSQLGNKDFVEFPSLTAHLLNDHLQNPIQTFMIARVQSSLKPVLTMLHHTLPPDVIFSNVKTMMTDGLAFSGTGVTLYRRKSSCVFMDGDVSKAPINLKTLFKNVDIDQLDKMALTHVHLDKPMTGQQNIHLEPGEMDSFYIRWK
ncbi:alpha-mannosidase 2x-like [Mizuhopecten yessoensis]|nr:alpha-mannosidase 2x-like [Mizuhopecten yessoensis]